MGLKLNHMEQKIWFITGISSGLGQALAQALLEKDVLVLGTFRQQQQADAFNATAPPNAFAYVLDVTDEGQMRLWSMRLLTGLAGSTCW